MYERLLTVDEVADILCLSASSLRSKDFRKKIGLNVIRVGGSLRFSKQHLAEFIDRNTESAYTEPGDVN